MSFTSDIIGLTIDHILVSTDTDEPRTGYRVDQTNKENPNIGNYGFSKLSFYFTNNTVLDFYHDQSCCESVRIIDITGDLSDLIGHPLTMSEKTVNPGVEDPDDEDKSSTATFYKFATIKGYVDVRWLGESNGHYSESVDEEFNYIFDKEDNMPLIMPVNLLEYDIHPKAKDFIVRLVDHIGRLCSFKKEIYAIGFVLENKLDALRSAVPVSHHRFNQALQQKEVNLNHDAILGLTDWARRTNHTGPLLKEVFNASSEFEEKLSNIFTTTVQLAVIGDCVYLLNN